MLILISRKACYGPDRSIYIDECHTKNIIPKSNRTQNSFRAYNLALVVLPTKQFCSEFRSSTALSHRATEIIFTGFELIESRVMVLTCNFLSEKNSFGLSTIFIEVNF